jgi:hypothetical protein
MSEGREFHAQSLQALFSIQMIFLKMTTKETKSEETNRYEINPNYDDDGQDEDEERSRSEAPVPVVEAGSNERPEASSSQLDLLLSKQHRVSQEVRRTNSGKFASLVDAVRSDVPIISHLVKTQEIREIGIPGGGHFSDEILDEYQDETPQQDDLQEEDLPASGHWPRDEQAEDHLLSNEEDACPSSPTLHIWTHTTDTVPSFETYAQSDYSGEGKVKRLYVCL